MQVEQYHILWKGCLDVIKDNVSEAVFDTWFKPIVPLSYKDNEFTIQVPTQFFYERLEGTFADLLNRVLKRVVGNGNVKLFYSVGVAGKSNKDVILPAGNEAVYPKTLYKAQCESVNQRMDLNLLLQPFLPYLQQPYHLPSSNHNPHPTAL